MLEAGRVFSAVPPLHRIELVKPEKGQDKHIYTYSDAELRKKLVELERRNVRWKEPIQRYKGLGEMDADQLAETTMDPRHRMLRRIRIEDAEEAEKIFSLLMGSEVAPRRRVHRRRRHRARRGSHRHLTSRCAADGAPRDDGLPPRSGRAGRRRSRGDSCVPQTRWGTC